MYACMYACMYICMYVSMCVCSQQYVLFTSWILQWRISALLQARLSSSECLGWCSSQVMVKLSRKLQIILFILNILIILIISPSNFRFGGKSKKLYAPYVSVFYFPWKCIPIFREKARIVHNIHIVEEPPFPYIGSESFISSNESKMCPSVVYYNICWNAKHSLMAIFSLKEAPGSYS